MPPAMTAGCVSFKNASTAAVAHTKPLEHARPQLLENAGGPYLPLCAPRVLSPTSAWLALASPWPSAPAVAPRLPGAAGPAGVSKRAAMFYRNQNFNGRSTSPSRRRRSCGQCGGNVLLGGGGVLCNRGLLGGQYNPPPDGAGPARMGGKGRQHSGRWGSGVD